MTSMFGKVKFINSQAFLKLYLFRSEIAFFMKLSSQTQWKKLNTSSIVKVVTHPTSPTTIIAGTLNGDLTFLNLSPFQVLHKTKVFHQFCTSMSLYGDNILMGSSSGELAIVELSGQIRKKIKLHNDSLSSIIVSDSFISTTGYDGVILFLNKIDLSVIKKIDLCFPIWNSEYFQNKIYLAGNPSFVIDIETYQIKKLKRFDSFAIFKNKLYGSSDERGLTNLKNNSNTYIPCNYILPLEDRMMIFSEESAGEVIHNQSQQIKWKCHRIRQIRKGSLVTNGCMIKYQNGDNKTQNFLILGDSQGYIYKLEFEIEKQYERVCDY